MLPFFLLNGHFYAGKHKRPPRRHKCRKNVVSLQYIGNKVKYCSLNNNCMETYWDKDEIARLVCNIWEPLTDDERQILSDAITVHEFCKNDLIYKRHDSPEHIMYIVSGNVKISKSGAGGRDQIIRVIRPGEIFGFRAFFADEPHMTTATAVEKSTVAFIGVDAMMRLMDNNTGICKFFIRLLSTELGISDNRTVNLTQKHIRGRLAETLLFLKERYGVEEDGETLGLYISREDIANLSNMTTNNAIRTLSAFADEKIITIDGKKIKIIHDDELIDISSKG